MRRVAASALLALLCMDAHAHQFSHQIYLKQYADAERAVAAKLAGEPANPDALAARVDLILAQNQAARLGEARAAADRCVGANPASSICAEALGNVLGGQASAGGVTASLGNARAIRDAFQRAIELDPRNYRARVSLLRYYLKAPFFVGGSAAKARELAEETKATDPELARLMLALCAMNDGKKDEAQKLALSANLANYELVDSAQRDLIFNLADAQLDAKRYAEAAALFGELSRRLPNSEYGNYGLATVARAQGKPAEAIAYLERAAAIAPRGFVYQLMGDIHEQQQNRARAATAYQAALNAQPPLSPAQQSQVSAKLAQLKQP